MMIMITARGRTFSIRFEKDEPDEEKPDPPTMNDGPLVINEYTPLDGSRRPLGFSVDSLRGKDPVR